MNFQIKRIRTLKQNVDSLSGFNEPKKAKKAKEIMTLFAN
jgi:hypothetical protein